MFLSITFSMSFEQTDSIAQRNTVDSEKLQAAFVVLIGVFVDIGTWHQAELKNWKTRN